MIMWIFVAQVNIAGAMFTPIEELKYVFYDRKSCEQMIKALPMLKCVPLTIVIDKKD